MNLSPLDLYYIFLLSGVNYNVSKDNIEKGSKGLVPRYKYKKTIQNHKFDAMQQLKIDATLQRKSDMIDEDCTVLSKDQLLLPGELAYTVDEQFMTQARMATRLAHFLSGYLQNVSPEDSLSDDPGFAPDRLFHVDQLYGEVLSMVMSDVYIRSSGIYFDEGTFKASDGVDRSYFAPFAFKDNATSEISDWSVVDAVEIEPFYADELWFMYLKEVMCSLRDCLMKCSCLVLYIIHSF